MTADTVFQIAGLALCGSVMAWVSLGLTQTALSILGTRRHFALRQALLREQIAAAKVATQHRALGWDGWRKFRIKWKVRESNDCYSLYLIPHDGKPLADYQPGQYVTLRLRIPHEPRDIIRCYSLSDRSQDDRYRVTVKRHVRDDGSIGIASGYLVDAVQEGDILDVGSPKGGFHLELAEHRPAVLIAAGVGITPLLSMINALAAEKAQREAHVFFGVRHGDDHLFRERLQSVTRECPQISVTTFYSRPRSQDVLGRDYDIAGRITIDAIRSRLPSSNFEFYLCGPSAFTSQLIAALLEWQVPRASIHFEAFGPASPQQPATDVDQLPATYEVCFSRSRRRAQWKQGQTLLDVAEAAAVPIDAGCRVGNCGACLTAVKAGTVHHTTLPGTPVPRGSCLPCVAAPDDAVTLDA